LNEVRWATVADAEALAHIGSTVYGGGTADPDVPMTEPDEVAAIAFHGGQPAAQFKVMSMNASRGEASLKAGGVAAVGVLPEFRGTGVGKAMMQWSLGAMRGEGLEIAALYPFRGTYYRQFGYEFAGQRVMLDVQRDRMPKFEQELPVRSLTREELPFLAPVLDAYATMHSGVNRRSADNWTRRMGRKFPMVYAVGDPIEAYCWTRMDGGFWDPILVGELIWSTPRGYWSILAFLRSLGVNRGNIQWHESSLSPFQATTLDHDVKITQYRPVMWRLLNLEMAFPKLNPQEQDEFSFEVHDEILPQNSGCFRVRFGTDGVEIARGGTPAFRCGIGVLSAAFLGEPSLLSLAACGAVEVLDANGLRAAAKLLRPNPTVCPDFF